MSHDTTPPPQAPTTTPELPEEPIQAGHARLAVTMAFARVTRALLELEGISSAIARALDATAEQGGTTT